MKTSPHIPTWTKVLSAAAILALATYLLVHYLGGVNLDEISRALHNIPKTKLYACGWLTAISFLALGAYDVLAVRRIAPHRVSSGRAWLVGAIANAVSNTFGFHALTGTVVRYRLLTRSGLTGSDIADVTALSWTALAVGFTSMFSLALAASAQASHWQRIGGVALLGLMLLCALWLRGGKIVRVGKHQLRLPTASLALAQMALGAIEMSSAIGALYVLMPANTAPSFTWFSALYIGAVLLGIASHAPGGLGVFEAAMLSLSDGQDRAGVLAALLIYRLIYNLCPFFLASLVFAGDEMRAALNSKAGSA